MSDYSIFLCSLAVLLALNWRRVLRDLASFVFCEYFLHEVSVLEELGSIDRCVSSFYQLFVLNLGCTVPYIKFL